MRLPWKKKPHAPRPRFLIEANTVSWNTRLWMDGKEISHWVTGYSVSAQVGELTKVTLDILPEEVRLKMPTPPRAKYVTTGHDGITREVTL